MKKTVLVTGSAKGIGRACVLAFAKLGYDVIINYLTSDLDAIKLKKFVEQNYNVSALAIKTDISDEKQVAKMIDEIINKFGKIDVLINNAAYVCDDNYLDKTKESFLRVLEVNVVGTFLVTKHAIKHMNNGTIINVSSTDADDTYTDLNMDYCASKAGVNSLVKTFSMADKRNKFISVMLPWVNTESVAEMSPIYLMDELKRTGQERLLKPDEVAQMFIGIIGDSNIKTGSILRMEVK